MSSPFEDLREEEPAPAPRRRRGSSISAWIASAIVLLLLLGGGAAALAYYFWPVSALKLTSIEIADRYTKDEFAADRNLTGKTLEVTGHVGFSYSDMVVIETPRPPEAPPSTEVASGPISVDEMYNRLASAAIRATSPHAAKSPFPIVDIICKLKHGIKSGPKSGTVTVRGVCKGRDAPLHLVLEECDIVAP
jgi:hypothetical protein